MISSEKSTQLPASIFLDVSLVPNGSYLGSAREPGLPGPSFGKGVVVQVSGQVLGIQAFGSGYLVFGHEPG